MHGLHKNINQLSNIFKSDKKYFLSTKSAYLELLFFN